ncbi:hypothetical protein NL676_036805 [Syzygium grande]|nr:hypothetical protein NL676_036805 [Syzygium grande]
MAVLILLFTFTLLYLSYKLYKHLTLNLPPGPRPWPVVGNLYSVKPVRFRCFSEWSQAYGPIISVWFGSTLNVVVSSAELARQVLKENDQHLANRHRSRSAAKFSRDGKDLIWADYGPHYVKVRRLCTLELFSPKRLEGLRPIREDEVTAMVESLYRDSISPDNKGTGLMVKKYLGGCGIQQHHKDSVREELGASLAMAEHVPWLRWLFPLEEEAFAKHCARRDRLTRAIMEEHVLARRKPGGARQHFVDALLTLQGSYDLSEDNIIGLLWDMITGGMDTTAISVEWAMAELVRNPRAQQKAQEELDRVIGPARVMTESDIPNLPYLHCVAKEALRLHPPTPLMLPHRANSNVKIGGYDIPKGSNVHVNVWAIARDPTIWERPLEFWPERFMEEDVDMKGHDFRLLPFGAGRRVCPGAQLGISLVMSMLGHLLHHFSWAPAVGVRPEEIDTGENPGLVAFMRTPLEAVPSPRLAAELYKRVSVDI